MARVLTRKRRSRGRGPWAGHLPALVSFLLLAGPAHAQELFSAASSDLLVDAAAASHFPDPRLVSRARLIQVSRPLLDAARAGIRADGVAPLSLNLFGDAALEARIDATHPTPDGGYTLSGTLAGLPFGRVVLAVNPRALAGVVHAPGQASFVVRQRPGEPAALAEVDFSLLPGCGFDAFHAAGAQPRGRALRGHAATRRRSVAPSSGLPVTRTADVPTADGLRAAPLTALAEEDPSILDVAVLVTRAALDAAGGHDLIAAEVDMAVALANAAFADSGVNLRARAVYTGELDALLPDPAITQSRSATEMVELFTGGWSLTLMSAQSPTGSVYESVPVGARIDAMREAFGADVLHVVGHGNCRGCAGLAEFFGTWGYTEYAGLAGHVFVHELGHNLGLLHDRYVDAGNPWFPAGHGYVNQAAFNAEAPTSARWRTIMAYDAQCRVQGRFHCPLAPVFSDPERTRFGHPLGRPGDATTDAPDGPANARRVLNETRSAIAGLREAGAPCPVTVTPPNRFARAGGGRFALRVTTPRNCRWTATTDASFVSIGGGERQGSGTLEFAVEANAGPLRTGTLQVAGHTVAVEQAAGAGTGVCDRAPGIREALVGVSSATHCAEVDDSQVAAVQRLAVVVDDLDDGDLAGFTGLHRLRIGVEEGPLPAEPFADLEGTQEIALWGRFEALPRISPRGLPDLVALDVAAPLKSIARDAFRGLPALYRLSLNHARMSALPAGVFADLGALAHLELRHGLLAGLRGDAFAGPSSLEALFLSDNALRSLPAGVFDGLSALNTLDLAGNALATVGHGDLAALASLEWLYLENNLLQAVPPGLGSLPRLRALGLGGNFIEHASANAFGEMPSLRFLDLSSNLLDELPANLFAGTPLLEELDLELNGLQRVPADLLAHTPSLRNLYLGFNNLDVLPERLFADVHLAFLTLHRNPGAPFPFPVRLELSAATPFPSDEKAVVARLARPTPFLIEARLTASNATLSTPITYLGRDLNESEPVVFVTPGRGRAVAVSAAVEPWFDCGSGFLASCPTGVATPTGPPLRWFKHNQRVDGGERATFDLTRMFGLRPSDEPTYAVSVDDPTLLTATIGDGVLTITTTEDDSDGVVEVTVTATDADGVERLQRFLVRVDAVGRSFLRGWRRVLLTRPGSETEGE